MADNPLAATRRDDRRCGQAGERGTPGGL